MSRDYFEVQREVERQLLYDSLSGLDFKDVKVLDAMAGTWDYADILYSVIDELFGCEELLGADACLANFGSAVENISELNAKQISYHVDHVEFLDDLLNNYFDIITNFRPNTGSLLIDCGNRLTKRLGQDPLNKIILSDCPTNKCANQSSNCPFTIYERLYKLLKHGGIFYAVTYNHYEMDDLTSFVKEAGFKSINVKPNNISEEYSINPGNWLMTCRKQ
ncbi:MAG: hypothetical protein WC307_04710 [Candidatus Nanoarchaeia archaeon]|jgi:hypothetical protein